MGLVETVMVLARYRSGYTFKGAGGRKVLSSPEKTKVPWG